MKLFAVFSLILSLFGGAPAFASHSFVAGASDPRILVIGDSHSVGPFGRALSDALKTVTPKSSIYASCGSVVSSWFLGSRTRCGYFFRNEVNEISHGKIGNTPKIPGMLKTLKPDLLVVELSGNYARDFSPAEAIADMQKLVKLIEELPMQCLWISAPDSRKNPEIRSKIYSWVVEAVGHRCAVLNAQEHTQYPAEGGDGIHYWREADVQEWVDAVMSKIRAMTAKETY